MTPIDKNARLCSKAVQSRIRKALDIIDSESMTYSLSHNMIEVIRLDAAIKHLKPLITNKRSCQLYSG